MKRRRFIAGAVCPKCQTVDRMVVDLELDHRECINCGFVEARPVSGAAQELATRVSRASARRVETKAEIVRLLDGSQSQLPTSPSGD